MVSSTVKIWKIQNAYIFKLKDATGLETSRKIYFSVTFGPMYIVNKNLEGLAIKFWF